MFFGQFIRRHKQNSLMRDSATFVYSARRTMRTCYNLYWTVEMLTTRDGPAVIDAKARHSSRIAIFFHTPHTYDARINFNSFE